MGNAIFDAMLPEVDEALRLFDNDIVTQALRAATGIVFAGLRHDVTLKASQGTYRAIAKEAGASRADPAAPGYPVLTAGFGGLRSGGHVARRSLGSRHASPVARAEQETRKASPRPIMPREPA